MSPSLSLLPVLQLLHVSSVGAFPNTPLSRDTTFPAASGQTFDFIIVGGGLTGLVVANRLSKDPTSTFSLVSKKQAQNRS